MAWSGYADFVSKTADRRRPHRPAKPADCEVIRRTQEILLPLPIWLLAECCNRFLVKLWPLKHLALTNVIVARTPDMGEWTELVFVEGHSRDNTYAVMTRKLLPARCSVAN